MSETINQAQIEAEAAQQQAREQAFNTVNQLAERGAAINDTTLANNGLGWKERSAAGYDALGSAESLTNDAADYKLDQEQQARGAVDERVARLEDGTAAVEGWSYKDKLAHGGERGKERIANASKMDYQTAIETAANEGHDVSHLITPEEPAAEEPAAEPVTTSETKPVLDPADLRQRTADMPADVRNEVLKNMAQATAAQKTSGAETTPSEVVPQDEPATEQSPVDESVLQLRTADMPKDARDQILANMNKATAETTAQTPEKSSRWNRLRSILHKDKSAKTETEAEAEPNVGLDILEDALENSLEQTDEGTSRSWDGVRKVVAALKSIKGRTVAAGTLIGGAASVIFTNSETAHNLAEVVAQNGTKEALVGVAAVAASVRRNQAEAVIDEDTDTAQVSDRLKEIAPMTPLPEEPKVAEKPEEPKAIKQSKAVNQLSQVEALRPVVEDKQLAKV